MGSAPSLHVPACRGQRYAAIYCHPPPKTENEDEGWHSMQIMDQLSLEDSAPASGTLWVGGPRLALEPPSLEAWAEHVLAQLRSDEMWNGYEFVIMYSDVPISIDDPYVPPAK